MSEMNTQTAAEIAQQGAAQTAQTECCGGQCSAGTSAEASAEAKNELAEHADRVADEAGCGCE